MRAAIHQPHYFPWIGYFDKMAKADVFVLLDQVQLEKNSLMLKNRVLDKSEEIKYITISVLDMLFNCGVDMIRRIFWGNVKSTHEFDTVQQNMFAFRYNPNSRGVPTGRDTVCHVYIFGICLFRERIAA